MTPSHDELMHDAAAYVLGTLDADERARFEAHLAACEICAAEVASYRRVMPVLAATAPERTPPPALRDRVLASIAADSARPSPSRRTSSVTWLAAAAVLLLLVGAAVYLAVDARRRADEVASDAAAAMAVLAAPDVARIELMGEAVAPQARARALWSRNRGMVFTVTDLPPAPAGRVYQVWVVTAQAPISAGLLPTDSGALQSAYFNTPADIPPPVAIAVTLEPAGGVSAPTGPRYLIGTPQPL